MKKLLIVSHRPSSNTEAMTQAVIAGVRHPDISGIDLRVVVPLEAGAEDVLWADGIILGTTENFGYMSGAMKEFFDRIYYPCLEQSQGLPYVLFVRAGNDGLGAQGSVERIVTGLSWKRVQPPLICSGPWRDEFLAQCEELGMTMAAGLEADIF
jgi:multimeric flavodoxin WrbA